MFLRKKFATIFFFVLLMQVAVETEAADLVDAALWIVGGAAVGAGVAMFGVPAAVGYMGFTAAGIAKGSTAAAMMSWGAGYTPAAVSVLQSIGAAGVSSAATAAAAGAAGTVAGVLKATEDESCRR